MQEIIIKISDETLDILHKEKNRYKKMSGKNINYSGLIERIIINHMLAKFYLRKNDLVILVDFLKNSNYDPEALKSLRSLVSKLQ